MSSTEDAITLLRSDNMEIAAKLKLLVKTTINKSITMAQEAETLTDMYTAIRVAELAGKVVGVVTADTITNVNVNAVTGFTFLPIEDVKPIEQVTTIEEADLIG